MNRSKFSLGLALFVSLFLLTTCFGTLGRGSRSFYEGEGDLGFVGIDGVAQSVGYGDNLGYDTATGDLNGDGLVDLVISAPFADGPGNNRNDSGEVYVFLGNLSRTYSPLTHLPDMADITIYGADDQDRCGVDVELGDHNGDGFDDLFIGSSYSQGQMNTGEVRGEVAVIYGGNDSYLEPIYDLNETTPEPHANATIYANLDNGEFGHGICLVDLNNDGKDELFICQRYGLGTTAAITDAGRLYLKYGNEMRMTGNLQAGTVLSAQIFGDDKNDRFGWHMAKGDIDNDGFEDLVISSQEGDGTVSRTRYNGGEIFVIFGGGANIVAQQNIFDVSDLVIYGEDAGDLTGSSISLGDIDNDNYMDVVLGAPGADGLDNTRSRTGQVWVVWGDEQSSLPSVLNLTAEENLAIYGLDIDDEFGTVVHCSDADLDGKQDIFITAAGGDGVGNAKNMTGEVSYVQGNAGLKTGASFSAFENGVITLCGVQEAELFGGSICSFDVDNDNTLETVIASRWYNGPGGIKEHVGKVDLYETPEPSTTTLDSSVLVDTVLVQGNITIMPGLPVKLLVNVSDTSGAGAVERVLIRLNPFVHNLSFQWQKTGGFQEVYDPNGVFQIKDTSSVTEAGNTLQCSFELVFEWSSLEIESIEVLAVGSSSDLDRMGMKTKMLTEVSFNGGLNAHLNGSQIDEDVWVKAGSEVVFDNVTFSFEGLDEGPSPLDLVPTLVTPDGNWTDEDYDPEGEISIPMTIGPNQTEEYLVQLVAVPQREILELLDITPMEFTLKVDNATPPAVTGLVCKPDNKSEGSIDNDTSLYFEWNQVFDTGSGTKEYIVEYNGKQVVTTEDQILLEDLEEGNVNVSVRARDALGFVGKADWMNVTVDISPGWASCWITENTDVLNHTDINISATMFDNGTEVDPDTIYYRVSENGTGNYADWIKFKDPELVLDAPIPAIDSIPPFGFYSCEVELEFPEGRNNYIQWKGKDMAGNEFFSNHLNVQVVIPKVNQVPVSGIMDPADKSQHLPGDIGFNGGGSWDPDLDPLNYTWLVDGEYAGSGKIVTLNITTPGNHTVTLWVDDGWGANVSSSIVVEIVEPYVSPPADDDDDDDGINPLFIVLPIVVVIVLVIVVLLLVVLMKKSKAKKEEEERLRLEQERQAEDAARQEAVAQADTNVFVDQYDAEKDSTYIPPEAETGGLPEDEQPVLEQETQEQIPPQTQPEVPMEGGVPGVNEQTAPFDDQSTPETAPQPGVERSPGMAPQPEPEQQVGVQPQLEPEFDI